MLPGDQCKRKRPAHVRVVRGAELKGQKPDFKARSEFQAELLIQFWAVKMQPDTTVLMDSLSKELAGLHAHMVRMINAVHYPMGYCDCKGVQPRVS